MYFYADKQIKLSPFEAQKLTTDCSQIAHSHWRKEITISTMRGWKKRIYDDLEEIIDTTWKDTRILQRQFEGIAQTTALVWIEP